MQKRKDMKNETLSQAYARFADLLLEDHVHFDPDLRFGDICRLAGGDPEEMDRLLQNEVGLSGEALVRALRTSDFTALAVKYKALPKK